MYDNNTKSIGEKIRYYRKSANMSAEDLGKAIGKSKATIVRYENNEILLDILTAIEICNIFNISLDDICEKSMHSVENTNNQNPFNSNLLYLYYISKNGIVISSLEITESKYSNYVLMRNGIVGNKHMQDYTGVLGCNYNTAFFCLTNAINNLGLDKFQIEIDLHSQKNNKYYGMFLGISNYSHKPTVRKCIITKELIVSNENLVTLFEELKVDKLEAQNIIDTKY